jgi:hypothetical protein
VKRGATLFVHLVIGMRDENDGSPANAMILALGSQARNQYKSGTPWMKS